MISYDYHIRVPYGDVDRMGFLYHAHYVRYFDMSRTELIRSLGITNLELEEQGVMLPVLNVNIDYGMPAHYDDLLTIRVSLRERPGVKCVFHYEVMLDGETLTTGSVTLAFMNSTTHKAIRPPKVLLDVIDKHM